MGLCIWFAALLGLRGPELFGDLGPLPTVHRPPELVLSSVFHGDYQKWCFDTITLLKSPPQPLPPDSFEFFLINTLPTLATHVTDLPDEHLLKVTWQATPHNQCQFVFTETQNGVEVTRIQYSQSSSIENHPSAGGFKVKSNLSEKDVWVIQPTKTKIGRLADNLAGTQTWIKLRGLFKLLTQIPRDLILEDQSQLMNALFNPKGADDSPKSVPESVPDVEYQKYQATLSKEVFSLLKAMYGDKTLEDIGTLYWGPE
jgi:hypothetical protein